MTFKELEDEIKNNGLQIRIFYRFVLPLLTRAGQGVWKDSMLERVDYENGKLSHTLSKEETVVFGFGSNSHVRVFLSKFPNEFDSTFETLGKPLSICFVEALDKKDFDIVDNLPDDFYKSASDYLIQRWEENQKQ